MTFPEKLTQVLNVVYSAITEEQPIALHEGMFLPTIEVFFTHTLSHTLSIFADLPWIQLS